MTPTPRAMASEYLHWAKLQSDARYKLATSGILSYPLSELPVTIADLEINGPDVYGYKPLQARLARKCGAPVECVVAANGTSMANHLAMAAILEPGDEVLIERPTYGILLEVASYLGANITRFDRRAENSFQIDIDEIRHKLTPNTKLIVLTNLHNPSGALTDESTLRQLGQLAAAVGAIVMVDEVYLDMARDTASTPPPRSCFHLGNNFVVTNSLTKAYGLSGLRCGWILAQPRLAERIWRLSDLFFGIPPHPAELLSVIALDHLDRIDARAQSLLHANRIALNDFLDRNSQIEVVPPKWGTVLFPRLLHGSVNEFCALLLSKYETTVVPGHFFEMPDHFRIGIGGDTATTARGLVQLRKCLEDGEQKTGLAPI